MTARRHPHPNPLPSRAREGICGVLPLKAREEKERGFIRGEFFPPYTEEGFSFLSSFCLLCFGGL